MNNSFRHFLGVASMLGAGVAFAGHGDWDTGYVYYEDIARSDRIVIASVSAIARDQPGQREALPARACRLFDLPGLDVSLWTIPCEAPSSMAPPIRMCRVFDHPGLDVLPWTEPCDGQQPVGTR